MQEYVYVLTNEAMPGLVKIGRTNDLDSRLRGLYVTSVPFPFECHYAVVVDNASEANILESKLHNLFDENRINPRREFFRVSPERVTIAISIGNYKSVQRSLFELQQPESEIVKADIDATIREQTRRSKLKFSKIGIPNGSLLLFIRDNSITCEVINNNYVLYDGQEMSQSAAALKVLQTKYDYHTDSVSGSDFWTYEGETLDERRQRLEQED